MHGSLMMRNSDILYHEDSSKYERLLIFNFNHGGMILNEKPFQDVWPEPVSHCFGCGRNNEHGLQIKSYWEGDEGVCTWKPKAHHAAAPGILCGGIIATLIDCHCLNTAVATAYRAEGRGFETDPPILYTTASLQISYLRPTPTHRALVLRARVEEMTEKKIKMSCSLYSKDKECARGELVAVRVPAEFWGP